MSKKRIPKASKKRLAIFGTISVIIILYFFIQLFVYVYRIYDLKKELNNNSEHISSLKAKEKELRTEIENYCTDDGIARYVRETYSYSKNGEYILKINDHDEEKTENNMSFINFIKFIFKKIFNFILNIDYQYLIYGAIGITILLIVVNSKKKK